MKTNEETTVSEEQVLFNKLNWENQQMILRIMRCLQPCELSCEVVEEKKIPEKIEREIYIDNGVEISSEPSISQIVDKFNQLIDYLKSKGDE